MHFYGLSYVEMLALPIYTFWEMGRNVDRIRAEEDIRLFQLVQQAIFSEESQEYLDRLKAEQGVVISGSGSSDDELDGRGLAQLRAMFGRVSAKEE
jgi:hypothetical protein